MSSTTTFRCDTVRFEMSLDLSDATLEYKAPDHAFLNKANSFLDKVRERHDDALVTAVQPDIAYFLILEEDQSAWNGVVCLSYYIREKLGEKNDYTPEAATFHLKYKNTETGDETIVQKSK